MKQAFLLLLSALAICSLGCSNDVSVLDSDFQRKGNTELTKARVIEYPTQVIEQPTQVIEQPTQVIEQPKTRITEQDTLGDEKPHHLKENTPEIIAKTPQPQHTEDSGLHYNRGISHAELGEYQQAIDDYTLAITIDPGDSTLHYARGSAYAELGEYQQAIDDYTLAIAIDPGDSTLHYARGFAYDELGEYQQAIDDYDQSIAINPVQAGSYINRGFAYDKMGNYGQAIEDYNQAIILDPSNHAAYINRGAAYSVLQEYGQAIDNYDQAISLDPTDPMTYFNRANAFYDLREYGQAIDNYDQAISLDPTNMDNYYSRGRAYDGLGEHERAIADYDRTTLLDPTIAIQITPVDLGDLNETYRGVYLKHYQADGRNTYFSDSIPHALVSDLHGQIGETAQIIKTSLGVDIDHQPDLYLLDDKLSFNTVERFLNVASGGFEPAGFYKTPCGPNKFTSDKCYGGVYANLSSGDGDHLWLHRLIAHEHTHSMIDRTLDNRADILASWLDEGLAQWVENEVVPHDGGEAAKNAAKVNRLLPLASLESRRDWNSRQGTDVELQYSEAHMAVSYFIEEFGGEKLFELIQNSLTSGSIDYSIRALTGISYQAFESSFFSWLNASN